MLLGVSHCHTAVLCQRPGHGAGCQACDGLVLDNTRDADRQTRGKECHQLGLASRFLCFTFFAPVLAVYLGESRARCRPVFPGSSKAGVTAGTESRAVGSLRALSFAERSARSRAPSRSRVLAVGDTLTDCVLLFTCSRTKAE